MNPPAVEESSTRAGRPSRVVDLDPVLKGRSSTTSTSPRAQNIVELYGMLPAVADDVDTMSFSSKARVTASGRGLASVMEPMDRA